MQGTKHRTKLSYGAGVRTYHVVCEWCGPLRGIHTTLADAKKAEAQHRREMRRVEAVYEAIRAGDTLAGFDAETLSLARTRAKAFGWGGGDRIILDELYARGQDELQGGVR